MMRTPTECKKCINCGDRDCYGKCDAHRLCDCKEPCKTKSCGAHWLFQKMSIRNGAHRDFYSVDNYCTECERLGCRCCTKCKLYYQCNCYGQLDNELDELEDIEDFDAYYATENAACYTDDEAIVVEDNDDIVSFYTCITCELSIRTHKTMKFNRLCGKMYCNGCFHDISEKISQEEVVTYYNTKTHDEGCDGWYNPETHTFHTGNWVDNTFRPHMNDHRNIEYYNNM
jgi:hypothetical protein